MKNIKFSLSVLSQANFIEKLGFIIFCLTANGFFPDLPVALADIQTKLTDYEKALDKSRKGDSVATAQAAKIRTELQLMVKKNGIYINFTANGDVAMLESCGYEMAKDRTYKQKLPVMVLQTDQVGVAKVIIKAMEGAVAYQIQICPEVIPAPDEEQKWIRRPMTTRTYQWLFELVPLKLYYLRFCYLTTDGESAWSTPVSFRLVSNT
jgi:hypothetical protein